jgi:hypothetical protein
MRRLDHIAAGVKYDFRLLCVFFGGAQRRSDARQDLRRQLQPGDRPSAASHRLGILIGGAAGLGLPQLCLRGDPRHVHHKPWVDPVRTGGDALSAVGADLGPTLGLFGALTASKQIEYALDDVNRIAGVETRRLDHRASRHAFAAAGAGIKDVVNPATQGIEKRNAAGFPLSHAHLIATHGEPITQRCASPRRMLARSIGTMPHELSAASAFLRTEGLPRKPTLSAGHAGRAPGLAQCAVP